MPTDVLKIAKNLLQREIVINYRFNFNPPCLPVGKIL